MKSRVYFAAADKSDTPESLSDKLKGLVRESGVLDFIKSGQKVALKLHFGEEGNTGFIDPRYAGVVCDEVSARKGSVFLSDTNTLYRGQRLNSRDHLKLAYKHGFTREKVHAEVVIPDDTIPDNVVSVEINRKFIKSARIARIFMDADALVAVSHFKGHALTGFGGALKNLGMGCASRQGKLAQHCDLAPVVYSEKCIGCGRCVEICPTDAYSLVDKKSSLDIKKCIGCASCLAVCPTGAISVDFGVGEQLQNKMVEYSLAVLKEKKGKAGFINFAVKINKECDCWGLENSRIAPDVGILASSDPVSIDQASFDLVNEACGRDIFKETHPGHEGQVQLEYAREIGIGNREYELIRL
ncbi:MAG: DUF362 domain-containing protein [Candidatus Omnitrophica bacterium]|jgi:hypothetical protein|nr:DUF362 domain-containing protein [Candidatus Omnitrophota bacterium]MDD5078241.1 DUF362 domain-containing protein [Candidatus Omnitrophota bacterium]MDD5725098.1 DUF362 domain-containing protein [Candidatus Omnitrophota bacterium]